MTSHSSTNRFNTCPFAYKLNLDGLHKLAVGPEQNYMVWGKAGHAALQAHYTGEEAATAFMALYGDDLDPTNQVWTREGGIRTIEAYVNYYNQIDSQWEVLATELADPPAPARPTLVIDLVARHKQSGSIYFWDHKFKAKMPYNGSRRYEIDAQISRYTDFVIQRYGDCAGAVINLIVPGYRQNKYRNEPAGWHFKFERIIVGRTPQQLEFWRESQSEWEQLIKHCEDTQVYPKHLGYNCTQCEYLEACYSGMDEEVVSALYGTEVSTPFEVVVEEE